VIHILKKYFGGAAATISAGKKVMVKEVKGQISPRQLHLAPWLSEKLYSFEELISTSSVLSAVSIAPRVIAAS
jgi:hypothetical protein